jgi:mono/diheme cytochrome c family protein/uncharacterized cupredoxin-like copper-binding protein
MTDERTGRELTPLPDDRRVTPVLEKQTSVERFSAGEQAHTVGMTEERAAQVVRQSGNARSIAFLAVLFLALFIPIYWFYDIGIPALGTEGRLEKEADVQYVTDVGRGYALYLANCARCHGPNGEGGVGPALNDQAKLYNVLTPDGLPGTGHLNPNYIEAVLREGGRIVCGDPHSQMPAWLQPKGPLNYREVEELIAFLTASTETEVLYSPGEHGEGGAEGEGGAGEEAERIVTGWRDLSYQPAPGAPTPPACWRPYYNEAFPPPGGQASAAPIESPGTADAPRVIQVVETAQLTITDADGNRLSAIPVQAGETVRFEVTNSAGFDHNFFIGQPEPLKANQTQGLPGVPTFQQGTKSFTWEVGEEPSGLQFACTVPGHYDSMHGEIAVQP